MKQLKFKFKFVRVLFLATLLSGYLLFAKPAFATTTTYRSASLITTDGYVTPYTNLSNCFSTDGETCDRPLALFYANLYFRNFGDFGIPDGATITHVRIRVTGKSSVPVLGLRVGASIPNSKSIFSFSCQFPGDLWTMYVLKSSVLSVYNITTPLTNGSLATCFTLSNIRTNRFIFRINYSTSVPVPWSANIDNLEIAFDYIPGVTPTPTPTPSGPEPFLDLPWDYEGKGKGFEEVVFNPSAWFDHEYPLQNVSCCLQNILRYDGEEKNLFYKSHNGYDYALQNGVELHTPVKAAASGWATLKPESKSGGAGNVIKIDHGNGYQTWYEHLDPNDLVVNTEEQRIYVEQGDVIGKAGMTGNTNGPHIHFSVFKDSNNNGSFDDDYPYGVVDPLGWEGAYTDPWEEWTDGVRYGARSYNLFTARKTPSSSNIPTSGGSIKSGKVTINVPIDALSSAISITLDFGTFEKISDSITSVVPSLFLNATDLLGQAVTEFINPIEIEYDYSDINLDNIDEDSLKFYFFNEETDLWESLPSVLDTGAKIITTQTSHFSQFAVMGEVKDLTPPVTDITLDGDLGNNNWHRSNVSVQLLAKDNEGGIGVQDTIYTLNGHEWFSYISQLIFDQEGDSNITFMSYDKADNREDKKTESLRIDKTPPFINHEIETSDGQTYVSGSWTNKDVFVSFSCEDSLSGVSSLTDPVVVSSEGENQSVTGECQDNAGNVASIEVSGINIDKTAPQISIWATPSIIWPPNGKLVPVTIHGSINELNLLSQSFTIIDEYGKPTSSVSDFENTIYLEARRNGNDFDGRRYILKVEAVDLAGNVSTAQTEVIVPHDQGKK